MLDIQSKPIEGTSYFYDAIPDIDIYTQVPIGFSIAIGDVVLFSNSYEPGQAGVTISGLGDIIRNSLLLPNTDYLFTYMLNEDGDMGTAEFFTLTAKRNVLAVDVVSEPTNNSLYFQKSIPDIILDQNVASSVSFNLRKGTELILSEIYVFDVERKIQIRNIGEIVEKYLSAENLIGQFTYTITHDSIPHTITFKVLKCEAEMTVDANVWTATNFLTRTFREKRTAKSRNEYLSFLQKTTHGNITKNFKIYYLLNNVVAELVGTLGTIAAAADQVVTFNASMGALVTAAALALDTKILQYDIWLTGTALETAKYTYLVDNGIYRETKNFVFVNCFGVLETFTATGRTDTKKTPEYNLGNIQNRYRKITQDFVAEKTINSGFLSAEEMEWIDDLLLSYDVAIYTPGVTGAGEEITLTAVDKTDTDANQLQAFSFGYRRAKNNHLQFTNAAKGLFDATFDNTFN